VISLRFRKQSGLLPCDRCPNCAVAWCSLSRNRPCHLKVHRYVGLE
jgi:hypothetical protein